VRRDLLDNCGRRRGGADPHLRTLSARKVGTALRLWYMIPYDLAVELARSSGPTIRTKLGHRDLA